MLAMQERFLGAVGPAQAFLPLFDHLRGVFFFVKDLDGRIVLANRQLIEHYGFRCESELIGKTDFDFLPRSLAEKYREDDRTVVETRQSLPHQIELFLDDEGIPDWYLTTKHPVLGRSGRVIGVMGVIQKLAPSRERSFGDEKLASAVAYLREHFTEVVSEREITAHVNLRARQLQRMFKAKLNTSFRKLLIKMRVHSACDLLRAGELSLSEISSECGFYDQSSFSRHFKKLMGMTPREYRRRW